MTTQLTLLSNDWCDRMAAVVLDVIRGKEFTADDLHAVVEPPEHPKWRGILFAKLKNNGLIEHTGFRASQREKRNGGILRVWRVKA